MITELKPNQVFVFGSNLSGRHGKGAALQAVKFGAEYGIGVGPTGQCYAIPTKGFKLEVLPLEVIQGYVGIFNRWAKANPHQEFLLTPIGTGLAGYSPEQIAPMFKDSPSNVILPPEFKSVLNL
jgi:hypothetical protein